MCSIFEEQQIACSNCKISNKINSVLYKLLCMNNFYESLDYTADVMKELFNLNSVFTLEVLEEKDLIVYRGYNELGCCEIRRFPLKNGNILNVIGDSDYIFVDVSQNHKVFIGFNVIENIKDKEVFFPFREIIRRVIEALYKRKLKEEYLTEKSFHDDLTGCFNRNYFEVKAKEYRSACGIGVIVCDMDRLKQINDSLGHSFGDDVIKMLSKSLKSIIMEDDFIFRTGGDEFVIITENKTRKYVATMVLEIKDTFRVYNKSTVSRKFPISVSVGYHFKTNSRESIKDVFKMADYMMYQHKLHHKEQSKMAINDYIQKLKYGVVN
ncbi:GGDEF domain-containing protein [uncultured Clostridium sp.]|uniref:GGDEF domain-containing protein n=1 Tax=uncultured Clostridium sp. TaxID=59620 RepID=UPI0026311200|nr:GGDEF domain-containing protein [uncultured Clostridium sp.]